jgi:hypothetical protein
MPMFPKSVSGTSRKVGAVLRLRKQVVYLLRLALIGAHKSELRLSTTQSYRNRTSAANSVRRSSSAALANAAKLSPTPDGAAGSLHVTRTLATCGDWQPPATAKNAAAAMFRVIRFTWQPLALACTGRSRRFRR